MGFRSCLVVLGASLLSLPAAAQFQPPPHLRTFGRSATPTAATFEYIRGIAVDDVTGDVYVPGDQVKRFDADGNFIAAFGDCIQCTGLAVDTDTHDLYVALPASSLRLIRQYTQTGQFVREWGGPGSGDGQFGVPYDVAVDTVHDEVYVIDGRHVQVFDLEGNFLRKWGEVGQGIGRFSGSGGPYGIAYDPSTETVWASDALHDTIQRFDRFGAPLVYIDDGGGSLEPGDLRWVRNIEVDAAGNLFECDSDNERIQVFDTAGDFVEEFRGPHSLAEGPFHPRAIAINKNTGEKYVAAAYAQRVDKFDANNEHVLSWGDRERDGEVLWTPLGIAASGEYVWVLDSGNFLVKRFDRVGNFQHQWGGSSRLDPQADGRFGADARTLLGLTWSAISSATNGGVWVGGGVIHYPTDPFHYFVRHMDVNGTFLAGWKPDLPASAVYTDRTRDIVEVPELGRVYVADGHVFRNMVRVYDSNFEELFQVPNIPGVSGLGVDVAAGVFFALSPSGSFIRKYDLDGNLLLQFGESGSGPGQLALLESSGMDVDVRNQWVLVADSANQRIQVFDYDGAWVGEWGSRGRQDGQFRAPSGVAVNEFGTVYVADSFNDRVQAFALPGSPECFDGIDNDGDGSIDFPDDLSCGQILGFERRSRCALGLAPAFVLLALYAAPRRRCSRRAGA